MENKEENFKKHIKDLDAKQLLLSVKREGISPLVKFLEDIGYFTTAASKKYHCNYEGGLVHHSLSLYKLFKELILKFKVDFSEESIIIVSLLHDVCKVYENQGDYSKGHSPLSIEKVKEYIDLTEKEEEIIKYHMGLYGTEEFVNYVGYGNSVYNIGKLTQMYDTNNLALLFYFCDHMTTKFLEPVV